MTVEEKAHDHARHSEYPSACIPSELTAFIAGYNMRDGESQWVSVEDRLPDNSCRVLCCEGDKI